jgi:single-strand DNA-binding protein
MIGYSRVVLIGSLVQDPEVANTPFGSVVANFFLTVPRRRPSHTQPGTMAEEISYIDVIAYNKHAESIGQHLKRGRPIFIEGHLVERRDLETGRRTGKIAVVIDQFQFLDPRNLRPEEECLRDGPPASSR